MIGTGRTAMAILDLAEPTAADVILVTGAAGGLGTLLVQAGRNAGATVVAAAGGVRKVELVRELGADVAVDYDRPGWADDVRAALGDRPLTIVFDAVGGAIGDVALRLLGAGGRFVLYGWSSGRVTELPDAELARRSITVRRLQRPADLRPLETRALTAAADGLLVPVVGRRFPLRNAGEAHLAIETRATVGKTVLVPGMRTWRQQQGAVPRQASSPPGVSTSASTV